MPDISEKIRKLGKYALPFLSSFVISGCAPDTDIQPQEATNKNAPAKNTRLIRTYQERIGIRDDGVIGETTCRFLKRNMNGWVDISFLGGLGSRSYYCSGDSCSDEYNYIMDLADQILALQGSEVMHTFCDDYGTIRKKCLEDCYAFK